MRTTALATGILALAATPILAQQEDSSLGHQQMEADLCEMGYARYDTNGDGQLSPSELEDGSTVAFGQLDADANDAISRSEYVDCVNKMAGTESASADRSSENMGRIDTNGDGALSQPEFMQATVQTYDAMEAGNAQAAEDIHRLVFVPVSAGSGIYNNMSVEDASARSAMLFMALDTDDRGTISGEEWQMSAPKAADRSEEAGARFDAADSDGSGDLTAAEYERMSLERAQSAIEEINREAKESDNSEENAQMTGPDVPVVYYSYDSMM